MSIVILKQVYFPIILRFNSDGQQFHQYQETNNHIFHVNFALIFFYAKSL